MASAWIASAEEPDSGSASYGAFENFPTRSCRNTFVFIVRADLLTGSSTPIRIVPGFLGAATLVPSAVEPNIASSRLAPPATEGISSRLLEAGA